MNSRNSTLLLSIYVCFVMILGKFFYWQVIKSAGLKEEAMQQSFKLEKETPRRGQIYFEDGSMMAVNKTSYRVSIYKPNLKKEPLEVMKVLEQMVPEIKNDEKLNSFWLNSSQKWITLEETFPLERRQDLTDLGLDLQKIQERFYPDDNLSQDVTGFLGIDEKGRQVGYGGLEAYYQKQLKGRDGFSWVAKDAEGRKVLSKKGWQVLPVDGRDLVTSINRSLQYEVEKSLREGVEKYDADSGSIIAMDPETGVILAMASMEASDASSSSTQKRNLAISNLFEPGSIFKPLIMSMALDDKSIGVNYVCDKCDGPRTEGEFTIENWDKTVHPNSNLKDIIKNSDNIGMSSIMDHLGVKEFLKYYRNLGLEQKTGVDLQGEARPLIKKYWPQIDLLTASFGQGIAINQLQMLRAFNAIANGGKLVEPKVVESLTDGGREIPVKKGERTRVFSEETTATMKEILKYGVENGAVAQFKPKGMEACAKSGTAQIAVKGGYTDSSTIGSYIGFSPCNFPKITMIVTINNPRSSPWGSSTAAPMWFELAKKASRLL